MVIAFLLHSIYLNEFFWGFLRLISGFSFYALLIIVESWLNEKSSNSQRGQILAIYTIIFYLSTALGQLFLTIPKDSEFFVFTVGSVLVTQLFLVAMNISEQTSVPTLPQLSAKASFPT